MTRRTTSKALPNLPDELNKGHREQILLLNIEQGNVTWHARSVRLWVNEHDYHLITKEMKALDTAYYKKEQAAGWTGAQKGPVELTREGTLRLAYWICNNA